MTNEDTGTPAEVEPRRPGAGSPANVWPSDASPSNASASHASGTDVPVVAIDPVPLPAFDLEVDASGLLCPLPILRAKKALAQLVSGQILKVVTTDRNAVRDFQAFARQTKNELVLQQPDDATAHLHFLRRR